MSTTIGGWGILPRSSQSPSSCSPSWWPDGADAVMTVLLAATEGQGHTYWQIALAAGVGVLVMMSILMSLVLRFLGRIETTATKLLALRGRAAATTPGPAAAPGQSPADDGAGGRDA